MYHDILRVETKIFSLEKHDVKNSQKARCTYGSKKARKHMFGNYAMEIFS